MKKINLILIILGVVTTFTSCNEDLFDIKFGLNSKEVSYTIQPTTQAGDIILEPTSQALNLDSIAQANGTTLNKVKHVYIKKVTATIVDPPTLNFEIIQGGFIDVQTGIVGDPDFDLLRIAEISSAPGPVQEFEIPATSADVLPFAKKPILTFSGKLITNGPVTVATKIKLKVEFEVVANPL
ncbi:MAG: hypothetical protein HUU47_06280 [Bacteroidetes bacterium]|nr:hypothetical protein [Bacteroidota bacterium]